MKPLVLDLFCGLGGWAEGFLAEGWDVVGVDIEHHRYPRAISKQVEAVKRPGMNWSDRSKTGAEQAMFNKPPELDPEGGWMEYPGRLILMDAMDIDGAEFCNVNCIVASPPCQEYSYMAMPWSRAKAIAAEYRSGKRDVKKLTALFDCCFRIQREASAAAGRHIPMVIENVRGAQPWVGKARWNFGSFYLWGDVPALMPITMNWSDQTKRGQDFTRIAGQQAGLKTVGHLNKRDGHGHTRHLTNQSEHRKGVGSGAAWIDQNHCVHGSKSKARKAASAMIAKIPMPLARWIAKVYKPVLTPH